MFCGMHAPQLVISNISIGNRTKRVTFNLLFLRNKTILTTLLGPIEYNILKAFLLLLSFENKSINLPHEALVNTSFSHFH